MYRYRVKVIILCNSWQYSIFDLFPISNFCSELLLKLSLLPLASDPLSQTSAPTFFPLPLPCRCRPAPSVEGGRQVAGHVISCPTQYPLLPGLGCHVTVLAVSRHSHSRNYVSHSHSHATVALTVTSRLITSHVTSRVGHITSHQSSHHVTSHHVTFRHITSHHITFHHISVTARPLRDAVLSGYEACLKIRFLHTTFSREVLHL